MKNLSCCSAKKIPSCICMHDKAISSITKWTLQNTRCSQYLRCKTDSPKYAVQSVLEMQNGLSKIHGAVGIGDANSGGVNWAETCPDKLNNGRNGRECNTKLNYICVFWCYLKLESSMMIMIGLLLIIIQGILLGLRRNILYLSLSQDQNILDKVLIILVLCSGMVSQLVLGLLMTLLNLKQNLKNIC